MVQEKPTHRRLRGYAFDPSLSQLIETVDINNIVYRVPWEEPLGKGPAGEYVEVLDYDPTVEQYYSPVDLNDKYILANDGLAPSESNPQFHQQMVYAVAMITIKNFEKALGRRIIWAPRRLDDPKTYEKYVQRLRIYPHALREANAYYSPLKKAILCGYFSASPADKTRLMPGSLVFTCLSHDIVAHEVTHAILDGLHRHYNRPTNPDVLAFHEAFADLVALFQHFSFPEVLKHQIAKTKGDLEKQNLLGQLAQQFGTAIGRYGSLRDALGSVDKKTHEWKPTKPDPNDYQKNTEPHRRGSILVAAVFEAFLTIYKRRIQDLLRIATGGTGILPQGHLHPDLVNRLANEASKTANHVLQMCIRAIDYCPPIDITFGDYLRGIITADCDIIKDDHHHYRLAFIDAFRRRGIYPEGIKTLSEESLRYYNPWDSLRTETRRLFEIIAAFLREYRDAIMYSTDRKEIFNTSKDYITGESGVLGLHQRFQKKFENSHEFEKLTGLVFNRKWKSFGIRSSYDRPSFQILDLRLVSRVGPDGDQINQIVFGLIQRMRVIRENGNYRNPNNRSKQSDEIFEVLGGCTLIFDLDSVKLKYSISKPLLLPEALDEGQHKINLDRIDKQHHYQNEVLPLSVSEMTRYFDTGFESNIGEPFYIIHNQ
jgi:hypothetical protein